MDKKVIALFVIALLGGLFGGFGLAYLVYQPQIHNLQTDLDDLSGQLHDLNEDISSIQNQMSSSIVNITSIQNQLSLVNSDLNALNSSLKSLGSMVAEVSAQAATANSIAHSWGPIITDLQSQLSTLNTKLSNLNLTVQGIENRSWHQVYSVFDASSNVTSGTFQLKGKEFRVMWTANGQSSSSWLTIMLRYANGTGYSYWGSSGIWTVINVEEDLVQSGQYYLEIVSYQTEYNLILWDYY